MLILSISHENGRNVKIGALERSFCPSHIKLSEGALISIHSAGKVRQAQPPSRSHTRPLLQPETGESTLCLLSSCCREKRLIWGEMSDFQARESKVKIGALEC